MCASDLVPILLVLARVQQIVKVLVLARFLEREYSDHDDEEDHCY